MDSIFEEIKQIDENKNEYWDSRDLCAALGYSTYQKFQKVLEKAKTKAKETHPDGIYFNPSVKKVKIGSGSTRNIKSLRVSKQGSYMIAECADSKKGGVKDALEYFSPHSRNQHFIDFYTEKANEFYLDKMEKLKKDEDFIEENTFFKDGIREKSTHHIMYKLPTIYSTDGCRGYEFLIEYDFKKPSIGIYYGCKAFICEGNLEKQLDIIDNEWIKLEPIICQVLNNVFPDKDFTHRFKRTDNANNGNYWPFWITLYEDENIIEVAARAVKLIKNIYEYYLDPKKQGQIVQLHKTDKNSCVDKSEDNSSEKEKETETAFTQQAFDTFKNRILDPYKDEEKDYCWKGFLNFLKGAEKLIFKREPVLRIPKFYEKAWVVEMDNNDFAYLISRVVEKLDEMAREKRCEKKNKELDNMPPKKLLDLYEEQLEKIEKNKPSENDKEKQYKMAKEQLLIWYRDDLKFSSAVPWTSINSIFMNRSECSFGKDALRSSIGTDRFKNDDADKYSHLIEKIFSKAGNDSQ